MRGLIRLREAGFTLIELLVVILIIGILVAVSAPSFLGQTQKAHDSATKQYLDVAYKEATAYAVDGNGAPGHIQGTFDGFTPTVLTTSEPELTASSGSCPTAAVGLPDNHIVIDTASGGNLTICADPSGRVWTLRVTGGVLQSYPSSPYTGLASTSSSSTVSLSVSDPVAGTVTTTSGTPGTPPSGDSFLNPSFTVTAPAAAASDPIKLVFTIPASSVSGTPTILIFENGVGVPGCVDQSGAANPNPCVLSQTINSNGDIIVTVLTATSQSDTWTLGYAGTSSSCNAGLTGDTPNNAANSPANDDFCHAQILSGNSGFVAGSLTGATIEPGESDPTGVNYSTVDACGGGYWPSRTVWYAWTAPASGTYEFDSAGSPAPFAPDGTYSGTGDPPYIAVYQGSNFSPACDGNGTTSFPDIVQAPRDSNSPGSPANMENSSIGGGLYITKVWIKATAGQQYEILVGNAHSTPSPDQGAFRLNWASFTDSSVTPPTYNLNIVNNTGYTITSSQMKNCASVSCNSNGSVFDASNHYASGGVNCVAFANCSYPNIDPTTLNTVQCDGTWSSVPWYHWNGSSWVTDYVSYSPGHQGPFLDAQVQSDGSVAYTPAPGGGDPGVRYCSFTDDYSGVNAGQTAFNNAFCSGDYAMNNNRGGSNWGTNLCTFSFTGVSSGTLTIYVNPGVQKLDDNTALSNFVSPPLSSANHP